MHIQLECTLKKRKKGLNYTQMAIWWNGGWYICSLGSLSVWNWMFCYPSLILSCDYFLGKAQTPMNSQRCLTHFYISHYFHLTPWTWETGLHTKRWLLAVSGMLLVSPSVSWSRPEFEPGFLPVWWVVFPSLCWFQCLTVFCCASEALTPTHWEEESPSRSSCPLVPVTRDVITHRVSTIPENEPLRNVVGIC
jgi:hypothetical protein